MLNQDIFKSSWFNIYAADIPETSMSTWSKWYASNLVCDEAKQKDCQKTQSELMVVFCIYLFIYFPQYLSIVIFYSIFNLNTLFLH